MNGYEVFFFVNLHVQLITYSNFSNEKELETQMDLFPVYFQVLERLVIINMSPL